MPTHRFHGDRTQTRRGGRYDSRHSTARKRAATRHHATDPCVRCALPLGPMGPQLHYDHDEAGGYLGFAHAACNLRAGAVKGNQRQAQAAGHIAPRTCSHCHTTYQPHHQRQRCCSQECRAALLEIHPASATTQPAPRDCVICGGEFQLRTRNTVACSDQCRAQRQRQQVADWNAAHPTYHADRHRAQAKYPIQAVEMSE